ncbi:MAG: cobalt-precorrin-3B C(17)-methyltransferase, partial [Selenomonadaceae bacterium]|nr:cobalt-precorrin-3B C(17)-methyltransferase [Selenomonadaceae bacterium]
MSNGKIFVVGIGPGGLEEMTPKALRAIESAEVVA